ncbi:hypothetical protein MUP77_12475, partial [Candidatus Bathyarchaeota archaeon]|nr:hypothetical protein [Candidatus Bathyarchaeota archaeon]
LSSNTTFFFLKNISSRALMIEDSIFIKYVGVKGYLLVYSNVSTMNIGFEAKNLNEDFIC